MDNLGFYSNGISVTFSDNREFDFTNNVLLENNKAAIFFDRDGIVNIDKNYSYIFKAEEIYPDFLDLLRFAKKENFAVGIATNQSGISRGLYSWDQFFEYCYDLNQFLKNLVGMGIDIIGCSWHPKFSDDNDLIQWRKPGPKMLLFLAALKNVKNENCIFIGDKISDERAAVKAKFGFSIFVQGVENSATFKQVDKTQCFTKKRELLLSTVEGKILKTLKGQ